MNPLWIFRDPALDGPTNMARDEYLLYSAEYRPAALRIYQWSPPTLSLGCFQRYAQIRELPEDVQRLAVVRRPTGGGAILHDREITYCLTLDDSLAPATRAPVTLYRLVHELWRSVLADDGIAGELAPESYPFPSPRRGPFFCFEKPGQTDLLVGARKLLGSAQRRVPGRVLQHGSLLLGRRFAAHPGADLGEPPPERVERWVAGFTSRLAQALGLSPHDAAWTTTALDDVNRRRHRYADETWTRRR